MFNRLRFAAIAAATVTAVGSLVSLSAAPQEKLIHVALEYRGPATGQPKPNFSPKGMQVTLKDVAANAALPAGAVRPAKIGSMQLGLEQTAWMPVMATATAEHPKDLCQLFVDKNRNGDFSDDGAPLTATPTQREKTLDWWSSMSNVELTVPYAASKATEKYFVNFWIVRPNDGPVPDIMRFSVGSWRYGKANINGVDALVAAMDDNNAVWDKEDMWSVVEAAAPDAEKNVLSINEARGTKRFMFVNSGHKDLVLEFRSFSPDGRSIDFAVVDKPMTKAADRKADDSLAVERVRPRTKVPFTWSHKFADALAAAKAANKKVFIDFETDWCGPCKSMDEWIWTDAEVAEKLSVGYVGLKLDGDLEKDLVKRFKVAGYPTMVVVDATGKEAWRFVGYLSSKEVLEQLATIK